MTRKLSPIDLGICKSDAERLLGRALNEIPDEAWAIDWTVEQQGKPPHATEPVSLQSLWSRRKKPAPPSARWFPAMARTTAALFLPRGANFHGQSMVDCWHASVMPVAAMPVPSGTG